LDYFSIGNRLYPDLRRKPRNVIISGAIISYFPDEKYYGFVNISPFPTGKKKDLTRGDQIFSAFFG
jgi:hypothetical protein